MYVPSFIVKKCDEPGAFSGGGAGLKLAGAAGLCKVGDQAAGGRGCLMEFGLSCSNWTGL